MIFRWSYVFLLLLSGVCGTSCIHDTAKSAPAPALSVATENQCEKVSQIICTREYMPAVCIFANQNFSGSNPCEAKKLARDFACKTKVEFKEDQFRCENKGKLTVRSECDVGSEHKGCTREFKPSVCRFGGLEAQGNNRCEALNALRVKACAKKTAFVSAEAVCEASSPEAAAKKIRSYP
ncbi:MAG: hypothetical protein H7249_19665 [Chitinophagaceae bacterium]|nr:hypothetical protein [Oligoflexus sp.]